MKETRNAEKNLSTREFNLGLINKYIIRSKRVEGRTEYAEAPESPSDVSEDCSSHSQSSQDRSSEGSSSEGEDAEMFKRLNLYKTRRL